MKRALQRTGLILGVLFSLFSCYSYAFWGWVTATPLTPAQLERAQYNAYLWLVFALLGIAISVWMIVILVRNKKESPRFPVVMTANGSEEK